MAKCPENWEYKHLPGWQEILLGNLKPILVDMTTRLGFDDTRAAHAEMFSRLTPRHFPWYAGHYRGEPYKCIEHLYVSIGANGIVTDEMVGTPPQDVVDSMIFLGDLFREALVALDKKNSQVSSLEMSERLFLYQLAEAAADMMQRFLTVHPYANGNGHIARMLVLALLSRYGHRPTEWTVEPRPSSQNYSDNLIKMHRRGMTTPLVKAILTMLK